MEACNFGHKLIVEALLKSANLDLDAVNLRGQRADDVAASRGHEQLAQMIRFCVESIL
jgi:ankyrin repeat protein